MILGRRKVIALFVRLIHVYQRLISPYLPSRCRYQPTCSCYLEEAVEAYGLTRGLWLTLARLVRCNPLGGHGYDPVPVHSPDGG